VTTIDDTRATVHVFTFKEGVLSRLGHDLRFTLRGFTLELDGDEVRGRFPTDRLTLDGALRDGALDPGALSAKDIRDIDDNVAKDVLKTKRFPEAHFSGRVDDPRSSQPRIEGSLELVGRLSPLSIRARRERDGQLTGRVQLVPSRWGIKPFKALLGAIRIQDRVDVAFEIAEL